MSHELRTPMNAILGFSQILQMDPLEPGPKEAVKQIMMAGKHLLVLINEVLDISRIDAGTMSLSTEPVIVRDVVDEAIALVSPLAQGQGIKIHLVYDHPEDVLVTADKQRLRQCLINILSNAVKYNREKGEVRVTCRCLDRTWRIEIADTGLGISDEKKKRLFTPFDRLGAETTQLEGTGLGLALSQRMAQQMGGAMDLLSSDESGSVFFITLPIAESSAKAEAITEGDFQPATVPCVLRILYIEDNRSNFLPTEKISATRPYVLQLTAKNGAEGGTEILRALRGNEKTSRIPVIVLSADASSGQIANLMTKGARALLTEPIDVPTLWATLDGPLNEEVRHAA